MKAILVIDRPVNGCESCMFDTYGRCMVKANLEKMNDSSYCPLKSLPQKKEVEVDEFEDIKLFSIGWNACLDEIIGETE